MNFKSWGFIFCIFMNVCEDFIIYVTCLSWSDSLIRNILRDQKPYQITIFTSNRVPINSKYQNLLFQNSMRKIPTVLINLNKQVNNINKMRIFEMPFFRHPRQSTIYLIIKRYYGSEFHLKEMYSILQELTAIAPITTRPKCLLIYYSKSEYFENSLKEILRYAWTLKFLDFSILTINEVSNALHYTYNPFEKTYDISSFEAKSNIFPQKLNNVQGYTATLLASNDNMFVYSENSTKQNNSNIYTSDFVYVKTVLDKLNFTLRFVTDYTGEDDISALFEKTFSKLENNEITMSTVLYLVNTYLYKKEFVIGVAVSHSKMILIVPVIPISTVNFSFDILVHMIVFPIIILIFAIAVRVLKLPGKNWKIIKIFQIFLGIPTLKVPQKIIERFIFLTIIILSLKYSSSLMSRLTDIRLIQDEQHFDSIEDFFQSKMTIYTRDTANEYDSVEVKKLFSRSKKIRNLLDCVDLVLKNKDTVCVSTYYLALALINRSLKTHGVPLMKIAKPSFRQGQIAFGYEKASPYAEKFDQLLQFLQESGIPDQWRCKADTSKRRVENVSVTTKDTLFKQLIIITFVGCTLAVLVFICELISHRLQMRRNKVFR